MIDTVIAEPVVKSRPTAIMWPLRITAGLILVAVLAQPVWIGLFITGDVAASMAHATGAATVALLALIHLVLSILRWKPGGGSARGVRISGMFLGFVFAQSMIGMFKVYPLHFLVGVLMAMGAMQLVTNAWRDGRSPAKEGVR